MIDISAIVAIALFVSANFCAGLLLGNNHGIESMTEWSKWEINRNKKNADKLKQIKQIVKAWNDMNSFDSMKQISEVLEDDNT